MTSFRRGTQKHNNMWDHEEGSLHSFLVHPPSPEKKLKGETSQESAEMFAALPSVMMHLNVAEQALIYRL